MISIKFSALNKTGLILMVVLLLCSFNSFPENNSQEPTQNIRGRVTDMQTTQPLPGASVVILDSDPVRGTVTDNEGYYELTNIPVGRVSLEFSFMGYHSRIVRNVDLQSGKELVINIDLDERVIMGEEVVIVGNMDKDRPANELAKVSARSFTVEETERYAGTRNDVARMASNFAGVMGNDDSRNDIIIRGNSPTGLLWRLEGMDIPNPNHFGATGTTGGPVSMLNNTLLANSDFMTGAFPAQYGNATAGVFDLKMRPGNNRTHEFLGQIGFNGFELGAEGPFSNESNASFLINYRYSTLGVFEKLGIGFGTSGVPYYQDLSFKINVPSTPLGNISLFGLGGKSDIEIWDSRETELKEDEMYGASGYDLTNSVDMALVGVSSTKTLSENAFVKTTIGVSGQDNYVIVDSLSDDRSTKYPNYQNNFLEKNLNISSFYSNKLNRHHLIKAGIEYKKLGYNYNDSAYQAKKDVMEVITNSSGNTALWQPWFQWQYRITEEIEITGGLLLSHFRLTGESVAEPRAAISWDFLPRQSISLGYGLHSQTAPLHSYFSRVRNNQGLYTTPNKDLTMMKSRHLVLGYDRNLGDKTRLKLETYYQHLFDVPVDQTGDTPYSILNEGANFWISTPEYLEASGTGWNYGLEMTLERFLHKGFYYLLTGSLFESKYKDASNRVLNTAFNNNFVFNLLAGKEFEVGKKDASKRKILDFNIKTTWAGGKRRTPFTPVLVDDEYKKALDYDETFGIRLKDYFTTHFSCSFRVDGKNVTQEWGIEISNLFNTRNIFDIKFDNKTGEVDYTYQLGFMLVPQYRIIF